MCRNLKERYTLLHLCKRKREIYKYFFLNILRIVENKTLKYHVVCCIYEA